MHPQQIKMNINDLPQDVLERILIRAICNVTELLKTSLVCKKFNEVIQNCPKLMKSLTITWKNDMKDPKPLLASSRKYRKVTLKKTSIYSAYLLKFLEQQPIITKLDMEDCKIPSFILWKIINQLKDTLVNLRLYKLEVTDCLDLVPICLPSLKNLYVQLREDGPLRFDKTHDLFELPLNIEKFEYVSEKPVTIEEHIKYQQLIATSKKLKNMKFHHRRFATLLFNESDFVKQCTFQLETLDIWLELHYREEQCSNLALFLRGQTFLKQLEMSQVCITSDILTTIMNMSTLNTLTFVDSKFQITRQVNVKNTTLETLKIELIDSEPPNSLESEIGISKIIQTCPFIKNLTLRGYSVTQTISETIAELENLRYLSICIDVNAEIYPVNFESVSYLKITGVMDEKRLMNIILEVVKVNRQLKEVETYFDIVKQRKFQKMLHGLKLPNLELVSC